ncbi:UDP-N-acetylmuramoyl-L-alanyl-D-glutamate--2,6-diaminopimelate ligase, partial [Stenotrophomonas rhizophila]|nr:UDP-N-acetylmuramoyl-L-alanyl-D-glutamate--2,6-diaminopimelate ligase [Stenotrophomonas rhizophila]
MSQMMLLSQLLPDVVLSHDPSITGLVLDSRAVRPGNAFVAIAGFGAHGLGF